MSIPKIKEIKIDSQQYILIVLFDNGIIKEIDFKQKLQDDLYSDLNNRILFEQAQVDVGGYGVSWNEDIDISRMSFGILGKLLVISKLLNLKLNNNFNKFNYDRIIDFIVVFAYIKRFKASMPVV